jgi:hypothetical protein
VATQALAQELEIGIFFTDMRQLKQQLADEARMEIIRAKVWRQREKFTFDYHADRLVAFFRQVIEYSVIKTGRKRIYNPSGSNWIEPGLKTTRNNGSILK